MKRNAHKALALCRLPVPRLRIRSRQGTTFCARTQRRPTAPRSLRPALPMPWSNLRMSPSSSFASEWRQARRRRCMTSRARDWCLVDRAYLRDTHPDGAPMNFVGEREISTGFPVQRHAGENLAQSRWNFWHRPRGQEVGGEVVDLAPPTNGSLCPLAAIVSDFRGAAVPLRIPRNFS